MRGKNSTVIMALLLTGGGCTVEENESLADISRMTAPPSGDNEDKGRSQVHGNVSMGGVASYYSAVEEGRVKPGGEDEEVLCRSVDSELGMNMVVNEGEENGGGVDSILFELNGHVDKDWTVVIGTEMEDGEGNAIVEPEIGEPHDIGDSSGGKGIQEEFTLPDDLQDGAYVVRAMAAGEDQKGNQELHVEELFVIVDGGSAKEVSFDDWLPHINESEPVVRPEDPDPEKIEFESGLGE